MDRTIALGALLAIAPFPAYAFDTVYAEGSVGAAFVHNVESQPISITAATGESISGNFELDYGTSITGGLEFGLAGAANNLLRMGVSYDFIPVELDSLTLNGSYTDAFGTTTTGSLSLTPADVGVDFDNNVHIVQFQSTFNGPIVAEAFRPYFGLGGGMALIDNASEELALSGTLGLRAQVSEASYVGLRYRYQYIMGPTDDLGAEYENIAAQSIGGVLGFYF